MLDKYHAIAFVGRALALEHFEHPLAYRIIERVAEDFTIDSPTSSLAVREHGKTAFRAAYSESE